jgi:hypothetical protein
MTNKRKNILITIAYLMLVMISYLVIESTGVCEYKTIPFILITLFFSIVYLFILLKKRKKTRRIVLIIVILFTFLFRLSVVNNRTTELTGNPGTPCIEGAGIICPDYDDPYDNPAYYYCQYRFYPNFILETLKSFFEYYILKKRY